MLTIEFLYNRPMQINYIYKKKRNSLKKKKKIFYFFYYRTHKKPIRFFLLFFTLSVTENNGANVMAPNIYLQTSYILDIVFFNNLYYLY